VVSRITDSIAEILDPTGRFLTFFKKGIYKNENECYYYISNRNNNNSYYQGEAMEKKQNFSRKREAILNALRSTTIHPTAEWVYQKLKPEYPDLSLGTVYRNLAQFKQSGAIISVGVVNGQERYDGNTHPHTHFICSGCGAVLDVPGEYVRENSATLVSETYHLEVDSCDVVFHGLCTQCIEKQQIKN